MDRYERTLRSGDRTLGFRPPDPADAPVLWELAGSSGLDLNSHYAYAMWGEYFADTSLVADELTDAGTPASAGPAGFVIGFRPPQATQTLFVWQVAVADAWRGAGLATGMIEHLVARTGATCVEATVTPSNEASARLFRRLGGYDSRRIDEEVVFGAELFPGDHEPEVRFRVQVDPRRPLPAPPQQQD